jgi:RNA polymerase sigma-70 factor (ECF subfamily)
MRELYNAYAWYLTAVCHRYITDRDEAKDILQDAFIKVFSQMDRFEYRGEGSLRAWMTRILVNDALKALRKKPVFSLVDNYPDVAEEDDSDPGFADVPMPVIMDMIRSLPDGYRTVFNLFVFENKSHKEIADLLGIRENSSCSQYFRARALLAKQIKEYKRKQQ